MAGVRWDKYPAIEPRKPIGRWLEMQANLGLAPNTIDAYGRALDDYVRFSSAAGVEETTAGREHVARWVNDLSQRPSAAAGSSQIGLANATIQQRLTAVRLFYDHLVFERVREQNPVGRGPVYALPGIRRTCRPTRTPRSRPGPPLRTAPVGPVR
jgi:integrase/recombinase XerD